IPQDRTMQEYVLHYGQLAKVLTSLEFTQIYRSFWFVGLLFLFSFNILVCTLTRLSPKLKRAFNPKIEKEAKNLTVLKVQEQFSSNWDLANAKEKIKEALQGRHYRLREESGEGKAFLLARKKTSGLFGADIVHLGLLVILAGGIISGMTVIKNDMQLYKGLTLPVMKADFQIRLDNLERELYDNGGIKDWKSTVTVIENGEEKLSKIIEVNHPLSYKGYMFYQSAWGYDWQNPTVEIWAKKKDNPDYAGKVQLRIGERVKLEGENLQIAALQFTPDFIIGEGGQVATRSQQPNNPAVYIEGWQEETLVFSGWIFAQFPDFSRIHSEEETNLTFELKGYQGGEISVLNAAKDPGANLIWLGCVFLMAGLGLAFYWPPREIKLVLETNQSKTDITAGGISSKNKDAFRAEFENIMTTLRRQS
ncbi:MAG: cytochrome c biogenesis protein ResB, partial [Candidatus Aminicenantes bacterium]|nr:cytochrome c biogenesis protein ResB [Candidatus Aminicenantes bacterium]